MIVGINEADYRDPLSHFPREEGRGGAAGGRLPLPVQRSEMIAHAPLALLCCEGVLAVDQPVECGSAAP
jgi:hypothetical protein